LPACHRHAHRQPHADANGHANRNTAADRAARYYNALCRTDHHGHTDCFDNADEHAHRIPGGRAGSSKPFAKPFDRLRRGIRTSWRTSAGQRACRAAAT
jgi:hypothetical protein